MFDALFMFLHVVELACICGLAIAMWSERKARGDQ